VSKVSAFSYVNPLTGVDGDTYSYCHRATISAVKVEKETNGKRNGVDRNNSMAFGEVTGVE
jgi:hypothetical protein